jgi:manganese/iron transport system permease protein
MSFLDIFGVVLVAALLGGWSAGTVGVFVIGLRMPFLAVSTAHAALAGAVFADWMGFPHTVGAFVAALVAAALLGWLLRGGSFDPNVALGTLFSVTLGLTFLGIGLSGGPKAEVLGLLWGSLLLVSSSELKLMTAVSAVLALFLIVFNQELKLLLFSRQLASVLINETAFLTALLVLEAGVIAVNLDLVGGLLLFGLIFNPAVAAMRLARTYRAVLVLSGLLGASSAVAGFLVAYWLNLPVGACIALVSALPVGISRLVSSNLASEAA